MALDTEKEGRKLPILDLSKVDQTINKTGDESV